MYYIAQRSQQRGGDLYNCSLSNTYTNSFAELYAESQDAQKAFVLDHSEPSATFKYFIFLLPIQKKKKNSYKNSYEVKLYPVSPVDWDNMVVSRLLQSTNSCMYVLALGLYFIEWYSLILFQHQCNACAFNILYACYIYTKFLNHSSLSII